MCEWPEEIEALARRVHALDLELDLARSARAIEAANLAQRRAILSRQLEQMKIDVLLPLSELAAANRGPDHRTYERSVGDNRLVREGRRRR